MLYIHFPFCKQKCIYCNFYSIASLQLKEAYWDALCREMEMRQGYLVHDHIDTLYFGGGTPSLCTISELEKIISHLQKFYPLSEGYEFTMECNPEQLTKAYLCNLKSLGINRLSIGVQSFNDEILKLLRRCHSGAQAVAAVENAAVVGFDNLSLDLIYDIAFRTAEMWRADLSQALSLPVTHLSCYSLTVEENTTLARKQAQGIQYQLDDAETERDYAILAEMTTQAGFEQYEISNFAKNGCISRHNSGYWNRKPYLGLGAAAHSFNGNSRKWNVADVRRYIAGINAGQPDEETETLSLVNQYDEYVLLRLRTKWGVDLSEVAELFGEKYRNYLLTGLKAVKSAYYTLQNDIITLTYTGRLFADAIAMELMSMACGHQDS